MGQQGDAEPSPESFETYEEYVKAVARHAARQERETVLREAEEHRRRTDAERSFAEAQKQFTERLSKSAELVRDESGNLVEMMVEGRPVDDRLLAFTPSSKLPPGVEPGPDSVFAELLFRSENSPALFRYFSDNEQEVVRVLRSPNAIALAAAVGKIEARLEKAPVAEAEPAAPSRPAISQARPPIRPVSTSPSVSEEDLSDDADFDKHYRIMQAREHRAGRR